jgi:hypothetical protein
MSHSARWLLLLLSTAAVASACALRLGGPSPQDYNTLALHAPAGEAAAATAERIRQLGSQIVLLSAESDSAWFASVAADVGLALSGPGRTGPRGMAFLTNLEILGDTSLVLDVNGGGRVHMHDALYLVDANRFIDLMMVRLDGPDLRAAVRTLLSYIATDVGSNSAIVLVVEAASPQLADSAAILMRATLGSGLECAGEATRQAQLPDGEPIRLLYGPSARMQCSEARPVPAGIFARLRLQR